jgi:hypothetical protein
MGGEGCWLALALGREVTELGRWVPELCRFALELGREVPELGR